MANKPIAFRGVQRARIREASNQRIKGTIIVNRYLNCIGQPHDIDADTKLDDILKGGLVKWDLGLMLNGYTPFRLDGLLLQKRDVMKADTINDLGNLIFEWYRGHGWSIV